MSIHTIASYNMSFASDMGAIIGSEKHFIKQGLEKLGQEDKRALWKNAAKLVKHFWDNEENASAMGLQEMNQRVEVRKKNQAFDGGVEAIKELLNDSSLSYNVCGQATPFGVPTLLTIWKTDKLGSEVQQYCADLTYDPPKQSGRPISIVKTDKGFVLINLHAPNALMQSRGGMKELRAAINEHLTRSAIEINDPKKLFIMGDFNDPLFGINDENPLEIGGHELKTGSGAIKSCCFNFNSSCPEGLFNSSDEPATLDGLVAEPRSCFIRKTGVPETDEDVPKSAPRIMGERGLLENYRFTGDYVLGKNVVSGLKIYRPPGFGADGYSTESDHEMVYATFSSEMSGGKKRRNKNRTKRRNKNVRKSKRRN
jgi:hypothetical protein